MCPSPQRRSSWPASQPPVPALGADEAAFPVTVVDDEGTEVVVEALPERIISLSPANTEIVFTLGAGDRLVGGTDFDDYPPEAAALPDVATFNGVVMEQVVELEPDLVLAAGNNFTPADDIARMRELGLPVVVVYAETVDEVLADIELIGEAIGEPEAAESITASMTTRLEEVSTAATEIGSTPRTFYQLGSEPEIYGPAPDSFIADMIELAGGDPVTTSDPAVFSIPVETLDRRRPRGHRRRRRELRRLPCRRHGAARLVGHHRGQGGSRPRGRRHPRHAARAAPRGWPRVARARRSTPTSSSRTSLRISPGCAPA